MFAAFLSAVSLVAGMGEVPALADASNDGQFVPLWQTPVLDTRSGLGTDSGTVGKIPANGAISVQLIGKAGIPDWGIKAVSSTITVHKPAASGWLAVYPSEEPVNVSTVVYTANESVTGADFTRITSTRRTTFFNHSDQPVDVTLSTDGYFISGDQAGGRTGYQPVASSVLYDSREGVGVPERYTPISAGGSLTINVAGENGIASGAAAAALNIVAAGQTQAGSLGVHPSDAPKGASVLNFVPGEEGSAFAIAQLSGTGKLTLENSSTGTVHVSISVRGYFDWAGTGGKLKTVPTKVVLQTLDGTGVTGGSTAKIPAGGSIVFDATGFTGVGSLDIDALALAINVRQPTHVGWVSVYAADQDDPWLSSVSFTPNESNVGFDNVIPSPSGLVKISNHSYGTVHLEVSARGYYVGGGGACARAFPEVGSVDPEDVSCDDGEYVEPDLGDTTGGDAIATPGEIATVEDGEAQARAAKESLADAYDSAVTSIANLTDDERAGHVTPTAASDYAIARDVTGSKLVVVDGEQVAVGAGAYEPLYAVMARPSNYLRAAKQYPQKKSYYCGPAAGVSIAKMLRASTTMTLAYEGRESQAFFAQSGWMWTNSDHATNWSRGSFQRAMNKYQGGKHHRATTYISKHRPSAAYLKSKVRWGIDNGVPGALNGVYFPGSSDRYREHPNPSRAIGHWVAFYGYSGTNVFYTDSVFNSRAVSWSGSLSRGKQWVSWARATKLAASNGIVW